MRDGFRAIDSELHLMEPYDLWERRLAEPYRSRVKITSPPNGRLEPGRRRVEVDGKNTAPPPIEHMLALQAARSYSLAPVMARAATTCTPENYVEGLDLEGIDVAVLSPTTTMTLVRYDGLDPRLAAAICRVYNDWAYEFTQANPARFKFWGFLPPQDAHLAAEEARRCVEELGAVGVATIQGAIDGHLWSDEFFDPLWEAISALGVPFGLHVSFAGEVQDDLRWRYAGHRRSAIVANALGLGAFFAHTAVAELIVGGVLERYPALRPVIMESGVGWLPWLLWRLDEKWATFGPDADYELPLKPSDYWRRQGWAVVECEEEAAKYVIDYVGGDHLLLSTDFPHHDSPFPNGIKTFLALPGLEQTNKRKILWDNGARLFGLGEPQT